MNSPEPDRRFLTRRQALSFALAAPAALSAAPKTSCGVGSASYFLRSGHERSRNETPITETLTFLDYCHELGAGGIQAGLSEPTSGYAKKVRAKAEQYGMYFEASGSLPRSESEIDQFRDFARAARDAGASVIRTVLFPGRRYENDYTYESFQQAKRQAWEMVARAEPTLRKLRMKIAIENHKNLRIPDMLEIMQRMQSEYVGVTVDFGNNYVLMEDPVRIAEAFAPYALTSHIKDHLLEEYEDGIRLFDARLGTGIIDLPKVINILRNRQPDIKFNLETMTRDALDVPCFTEKYWATYGPNEMSARDLAMTVATARRTRRDEPLPKISDLPIEQQIALEDENNRKGLEYARNVLGL
jgi:sugar phosphate isomerase/epimerase